MPTLTVRSDIRDSVESYVIHMFLARGLKITFAFNLRLIIFFLVSHKLLSFKLFKSYLLSLRSSKLLSLHTVSGLAQGLSAQLINLLKTRMTSKLRGTQLNLFQA